MLNIFARSLCMNNITVSKCYKYIDIKVIRLCYAKLCLTLYILDSIQYIFIIVIRIPWEVVLHSKKKMMWLAYITMNPPGHFPGMMLKTRATRRHAEDMLERLCHLTGFGTPRTPTGRKEEGGGWRSCAYAAATTTLTQISGRCGWMD